VAAGHPRLGTGPPWWQSERRITRHGPYGGAHRPDAEVWWPSVDASPHAGQVWAVEVELTAKNALASQVKKLDAQQAAQIRALEDVPDGPAGPAMRARITGRFTELHAERTAAEAKLAALISEQPKATDPAILDEVPYAGDLLPELPPALKARLFAAFDLAILWNKEMGQATVAVTITDTTLAALSQILDLGQPGYHDTAAPLDSETVGVSACPPIAGLTPHGGGARPPARAGGRSH
jgi:hypothetical protein